MMTKEEGFYLVWNATICGAPTHRHDTYISAKNEAQRLARTRPGEMFVVLQSMSGFKCIDVVETDLVVIPF